MNKDPFKSPLVRIASDIEKLKKMIKAASSIRPLYSVLNENTPTQIAANANDYAPGDYDTLRLSTDASRNVSGFADGKKGRVLNILNVGAQNIVLLHQSALSVVANRIISPTAASITLGTNDSAILYYDSTDLRWRYLAITQ